MLISITIIMLLNNIDLMIALLMKTLVPLINSFSSNLSNNIIIRK